MSQHLGDETIAAMLEGALPGDAAQRARAHIAGCDACRQMVSAAINADVAPVRDATFPGSLAPGYLIANKYRIDRSLGEGGVGQVYAAHQLGLERAVAIKILRPELARDANALKRFQREARLVAALASEHVVRVHDLGELVTGEPYLVMELLEGEDLAQVVARGPVSAPQATAWILAACDAIGEAHALGILHRDLKPSNLFVTRHACLKVLDFGLAKLATPSALASTSMTRAGMVLGTPRYMAPEQITGARDLDLRADVWALGATLYHLVVGRPPFAEDSLDAIFASILSGRTPSLVGVPAPIAQVIQRALARDPNARFATVGELANALAAPSPSPVPRPHSSRRWILGASSVAAIGGVAAIVIATRGTSAPASPPAPTAGSDPWAATSPPPMPSVAPSGSPSPSGVRPAPAPASTHGPAPVGGHGLLGNMTSDRLRQRLEKLGWVVTEQDHDVLSCDHTRIVAQWPANAQRWADLTLLECGDRMTAASEGARLRRGFSGSWVVDDDTLVLDVATNTSAGSDEKQAKTLFDALIAP